MFFRQSRVVCCIFYLLSDLEKFIDCFQFADYEYAYIYHDKDLNSDGTSKPSHYHFYGRRKSPITEQSLKNFSKKCEQNIFYENLKSNDCALLHYFLHDDTDKYHYNESDIVSNFDINLRLHSSTVVNDKIDPSIIISMFDNGFNTFEIVHKYPKLIYSIASLQRYERLLNIVRYAKENPDDVRIKVDQIKIVPVDSTDIDGVF